MRRFLLASFAAVSLVGASAPASYAQDALGGAVVGGATGAAIGGAVGGGRGAAIGAGVGAATGAAAGASAGERRRYRSSRAEYVVRERPGVRMRTCWTNSFGERVCKYRSRY
jgi:uncharacterized protein YcfJ